MMRPTLRLPIALIVAVAVMFSMDCTCVFAASSTLSVSAEPSALPSCHAQTASNHQESNPADSDCCGKCKLEQAAFIERSVSFKNEAVFSSGLYDPFLAADVFSHGRGDHVIFIPIERRDLLYHRLTGASALPRSPPMSL